MTDATQGAAFRGENGLISTNFLAFGSRENLWENQDYDRGTPRPTHSTASDPVGKRISTNQTKTNT